MVVMSFDPARVNNAQLIADVATLGYLNQDMEILDCTYGQGRFWKDWHGDNMTLTDLDPACCSIGLWPDGVDFRKMPWAANAFDAVVMDPPYKLNGSSTGNGPSALDKGYGVDTYMPIAERHQMICDGITECIRVLRKGGHLLVKAMDQISSGQLQSQTVEFAVHAERRGARLVDRLHVIGHRAQPPGRAQLHAANNYSTLLIFRKDK